jgi:hypothetical protein
VLNIEGFSVICREPDSDTGLDLPPGHLDMLDFGTSAVGGYRDASLSITGVGDELLQWYYRLGKRLLIKSPGGRTLWEGVVYALLYADGGGYDLTDYYNCVMVEYSSDIGVRSETSWAEDAGGIAQYGRKELVSSESGMTSTRADRWRDLLAYYHLRTQTPSVFNAPRPASPRFTSVMVLAYGLYATLGWERWQCTSTGAVDTGTQIRSVIAGRSGAGNGFVSTTTTTVPTTSITISQYRPDEWLTLQEEVERLASMGDSSVADADAIVLFQVWEDRIGYLKTWCRSSVATVDYYQDGHAIYDAAGARVPSYLVRADGIIQSRGAAPLGLDVSGNLFDTPRAHYILETTYRVPGGLEITPGGWRDLAALVGVSFGGPHTGAVG